MAGPFVLRGSWWVQYTFLLWMLWYGCPRLLAGCLKNGSSSMARLLRLKLHTSLSVRCWPLSISYDFCWWHSRWFNPLTITVTLINLRLFHASEGLDETYIFLSIRSNCFQVVSGVFWSRFPFSKGPGKVHSKFVEGVNGGEQQLLIQPQRPQRMLAQMNSPRRRDTANHSRLQKPGWTIELYISIYLLAG